MANEAASLRYAACVLLDAGEPRCLDLGDARVIDEHIRELRRVLSTPDAGADRHARALDALVMEPVRAELGDTKQLFLSPDGLVNLVPFAALVDERGRYLVEGYTFTYVTSGGPPAGQEPVVVAAPSFDRAGSAASSAPDAGAAGDAGTAPAHAAREALTEYDRTRDLIGVRAPRLPGTAAEARALGERLAGIRIWTGAEATEARLRALRAPLLLHIATHGIWLQDAAPVSPDSRQALAIMPPDPSAALIPDPMLRSGLALAGFNQRASGDDDGFLTALEAASLDLHGTELVVLSACDTGLGEVESGQGVYGLRRALVVAGARTQVMSLWKIDDEITRELMLAYYDRLLAGEGRSEAMRRTQLAMLRDDRTAHPYYWAGFLVAGDPSPVTGLVPRPRSAGGCGRLARDSRGAAWGFAFLLVAAVLVRMRRARR